MNGNYYLVRSRALAHTSLRSVCMSGNYLLVALATCASEKYLIVMNLCKNKNASWRSVFVRCSIERTIQVVKGHFVQALDSPLFQFYLNCKTGIKYFTVKYVRSRHASLKALTRPFLGFVLNPK